MLSSVKNDKKAKLEVMESIQKLKYELKIKQETELNSIQTQEINTTEDTKENEITSQVVRN